MFGLKIFTMVLICVSMAAAFCQYMEPDPWKALVLNNSWRGQTSVSWNLLVCQPIPWTSKQCAKRAPQYESKGPKGCKIMQRQGGR
mmetsp:Transcript_131514/g.227803  ORF Transcript_131514/g.227803 Transcript_131514/m.227803 type:complete len:86 (+) Transcript_131514:166-423(+)